MLVSSIIVIIILFIVFFWYRYMKRPQSTSSTGTPTMSTTTTTSTAPIINSKYFPDDWYVGKTSKLDPTLRTMFPNALFGFPVNPLTIKEFRYFSIDGNQFEEVVFSQPGQQDYIIMYDSLEHNIYFLNRVMSQSINDGEVPQMVENDSIVLEENNNEYVYNDMSGLIEVDVTGKSTSSHSRLIRVYEREVTEEDNEFCICVMDKPNRVDYYVGFLIERIQLEDL